MQLEESIAREVANIIKEQVKEQVAFYSKTMASAFDDLTHEYEKRIFALEQRTPEKGDKGDPGEKGEAGPAGADGRDGVDGVAGKDGVDGKDGTPGLDGKDGAVGPKGEDGKDGQPGIVGRDGQPGKDGRDGQPGIAGRDGKDGVDGKEGPAGKDGRDGLDGKDGADGVNFEEAVFEMSEDGRTIVEKYFKGNELKLIFHRPSGGHFKGAWKHDDHYVVGDTVQCGGSLWSARVNTAKGKPGDNETEWQLIVRKGRDGKDGDRGPPGPQGPPGKDGNSY